MPFIPGTNIKVVGGKFNDIKGDLTVFDYSRHETNIDSNNMYDNKVTDSYNKNPKIISEQFQHTLIQSRLMTRLLRCLFYPW